MTRPSASTEIAASLRKLPPVALRLLLDRLELPRDAAPTPPSEGGQHPG